MRACQIKGGKLKAVRVIRQGQPMLLWLDGVLAFFFPGVVDEGSLPRCAAALRQRHLHPICAQEVRGLSPFRLEAVISVLEKSTALSHALSEVQQMPDVL